MANTSSLGSEWKPTAWRDGENVPRTTLPDGTLAEAMAALGYGWDATNSIWRKMLVDSSGNQIVSITGSPTISGTVTANQGSAGATAWKVDGSGVTQPVSGTFWQATQPVSGTVTANQGGTWTVQPGNTANTTAWKVDGSAVTQPVSGTITANQGGTWTVQPGNTQNTTAWLTSQIASRLDAANLCVTGTAAAGTGVTITLPAVASQFHYIGTIQIVRFAAAALTAAATPVLVTTTNLPGSPVFSFDASAAAQGTTNIQQVNATTPIKSTTVNTATTIVAPATTSVIWRVTAWYYAAV